MLGMLLVFAAVLVAYWFLKAARQPANFPPGPRFTLPVLGNTLAIKGNIADGFRNLKDTYGDVCGFYLGPVRTVIVHGYDLIHELTASNDFADRPWSSSQALTRGSVDTFGRKTIPGVLFSSGPTWVEQRRYILQTLRNLGFGKNLMESLIAEEVSELCKVLEAHGSKPIDIKNQFNLAVLNSLWTMMSSQKLDYKDPKLIQLVDIMDQTMAEKKDPILFLAFLYVPLCRFFTWTGRMKGAVGVSIIKKVMYESIEEHEKTWQEDNMRDLIDYYIQEMNSKSNSSEPSSFRGKEGRLNLVNLMIDLFFAGSETTSTTLNWGMLFMLNNPDVQKKVQEELDRVTGKARLPGMGDRADTPYTEAVIHEIQRRGNIAHLSVGHAAANDTTFRGHFIPKGTQVFAVIGDVLHDPKYFPHPDKFDPTRYLTKDGKFEPHPQMIPFGLGKRRCLGENLARMSLYMFFTGLLSRFDLKKANEADYLTEKGEVGMTNSPQRYKMRFVSRT